MDKKRELCTCGKSKNPPYCDHSHEGRCRAVPSLIKTGTERPVQNKILLVIFPYWTPLIPPQGIAHLKNFLQNHGYIVKAVDINVEVKFKQLFDKYFSTLKKWIPAERQGNIYNIGYDVFREHMMAHINYENEREYIELVKVLIYKVFYWDASDRQVNELKSIFDEFYSILGIYFSDILESENPEVLGVSVFRDTLAASLFALRLCREKFPHIKTVMGGGIFSIQLPPGSPNLEFFLEKTKDYIDKIIIGRGETALLRFLQGMRRLDIVKDIEEDISITFSPVEDKPDFSDFDLQRYQYQAAFGSTGCPFRCSFCNVESFYGKYREKNVKQTVEEMIDLYEKHGNRLFFMMDELLNPIVTGISKEFLEAGASVYWDGYFRVDEAACQIENALLWRRGGFYRARIGIESGSQRVLDLMNKKITIEQTRGTLTNLAIAGIKTTVYVVIGHPGETEDDFRQTLELIEELKNYIWEAECNPFTYFYSGQLKSDEWAKQRVPLYPEWAKDMLITQTWIVDGSPSREEMYDRVYRFVNHCSRLGVTTPWSLYDVNQADKRWKELHKNAVPSLLELTGKTTYVDECRELSELCLAKNTQQEYGEFDF